MLDLGLLGFANPWLLAALVTLPVLWWLLRVIPPAPRQIRFPAIRFLLGLEPEEETSSRTPPWLLILRLALAALLILALAGPVLNPEPESSGEGPLVLVVDDGWAAAGAWQDRIDALQRFTARAQRQNREVVLLGTAPSLDAPTLSRLPAAEAVRQVGTWRPRPWPVERMAALELLRSEPLEDAEIIWLSDGVAVDPAAREAAAAFAEELRRIGPLQTFAEPVDRRATLMLVPDATSDALVVAARRAATAGASQTLDVRALGPGGEVVGRTRLVFDPQAERAEGEISLPLELRNRIARLELEPAVGIGGVVLLDERWRRRVIGLVGDSSSRDPQPLLSELYYIERALTQHAELRLGQVSDLLAGGLSEVILPDGAQITPEARADLEAWIEQGGVLLRFAGPRLANAEDDLVPVRLRRGDRNLDGALSWARPLPLGPFPETGPLAGLTAPGDDVVVRRQVLAQPGPELATRTWARLADGTPLITGEKRGEGWLVLVHTTANTTWSSLPISGVFVDILRRITTLSRGAGGPSRGLLAPIEVLDAAGHLVPPSPTAQPIAAAEFADVAAGPSHPPGLYGPVDAAEDAAREALNLASAVPDLTALAPSDFAVRPQPYATSAEIDLLPWLLLAALVLALIDTVIGLQLRGLLWVRARSAAAGLGTGQGAALGVVLLGSALLVAQPPPAAADDEAIVAATSGTRLAYVLTGLAEVDEASRAGLDGLSLVLNRRTAVEAGEAYGVDPARDDLNLFPLLYWPVTADHPNLGEGVIERLDAYLRQGGMILFDTGDAGILIPGQPGPGPGEARLRQLLAGLNLPPLEPVPEDHTLTRSFYLLQDFPGRWTGRTVWVERAEPDVNDGVSSVIIGSHGWAEAWAIDEYGLTLYPVLPGGEHQREMARRFGVNLVMYALTGNYKTDQVHVPALLERLGQ